MSNSIRNSWSFSGSKSNDKLGCPLLLLLQQYVHDRYMYMVTIIWVGILSSITSTTTIITTIGANLSISIQQTKRFDSRSPTSYYITSAKKRNHLSQCSYQQSLDADITSKSQKTRSVRISSVSTSYLSHFMNQTKLVETDWFRSQGSQSSQLNESIHWCLRRAATASEIANTPYINIA